jgi:hypothetical protein
MTEPVVDVVLLDCACGQLLAVPVLHVDESNEIHVDHDWLARHTAGHIERSGVTTP